MCEKHYVILVACFAYVVLTLLRWFAAYTTWFRAWLKELLLARLARSTDPSMSIIQVLPKFTEGGCVHPWGEHGQQQPHRCLRERHPGGGRRRLGIHSLPEKEQGQEGGRAGHQRWQKFLSRFRVSDKFNPFQFRDCVIIIFLLLLRAGSADQEDAQEFTKIFFLSGD